MKMKITRRVIQEPSVPYAGMFDSKIGYINLHQFTERLCQGDAPCFHRFEKSGCKGFGAWLRNNGGSESEAVEIVNMFVPKGVTIVSKTGEN